MSTIITKNSATSGSTPSSLVQGELAINVTDGRLFYGSGSGNVVKEFTSISASYSATSSFITASGVYGPYGSNSVISASHAVNGGVTQLLAGSNITLSPTNGKGQVTISSTGGSGPFFNTATGSYGSFYDTTTQTNPVGNIARSMSFNTTAITNGVSISGSTSPFNTYIKTENPGVYNIQFSAQVDKTDGGTDDIVIWLRKNGIDLTDTATTLTLPTNNSKVVAAWNWFVNSAANDYYQIIWLSADTDLRLLAETISGTHPGIPSVILTANRVDQFLSNTGSFSGSFTGVFTGSLHGTSSWANNATTASYVLNAVSSSFAANGGVTQIIAGTNITISPTNGLGAVTISSTGGSGAGANITSSFTDQSTWTFVHGLGNRGVIVQTYDTSWNQIIPQTIVLTDSNTTTITFPSAQSGFAIATLGGTTSIVNAVSASFASTASFVNTLNQNVIITGSLAVGTGSIGSGESALVVGPAPAGGVGEGGQIALLATGGSFTSSSFIDTYQDQFRIIKGPGTVSNAGVLSINLTNNSAKFEGSITASAYSGLPNAWLHALRNGSQTIGSGTWASRDIIFNEVSSNNFTYNSSTGIATLKANKTYRLTARLAWSAAGLYTLKFRVYNQTTSTFTGPTVEMIQSPNGTFNVSDNTLEHILAVGASDVDISIRTTSDTNALSGEFIRGDLNTQLIIQQIA